MFKYLTIGLIVCIPYFAVAQKKSTKKATSITTPTTMSSQIQLPMRLWYESPAKYFEESLKLAEIEIAKKVSAVENRIKSHRSLLSRDLINRKDRIKITIPIHDHLVPYLNEYCIIKGITRTEFITKVLKGRNI